MCQHILNKKNWEKENQKECSCRVWLLGNNSGVSILCKQKPKQEKIGSFSKFRSSNEIDEIIYLLTLTMIKNPLENIED